MKKRVGLIVNPVAGMGGRVALKGSDGKATLLRAIELGAVPLSPRRAVEALKRLAPIQESIELVTYPYDMGEEEAGECGIASVVLGSVIRGETTPFDTQKAAKEMAAANVDLLLFAGGDGTARDIFDAVGDSLAVLGIPSGVKIHSAVYAITPLRAGELARRYLQGATSLLREVEVMDIDEDLVREEGRVSARLYGYLKIPWDRGFTQASKQASSGGEREETVRQAIAQRVIETMERDRIYVIGPGTTTRPIMEKLGLKNTLLGVDVIRNREVLLNDAKTTDLLRLLDGGEAKIVVSPIGGQGYILGRGNQQISPEVVRKVGSGNIVVIATPAKIFSLRLNPLLVDTGDEDVDRSLRGYTRVITGFGEEMVCRVA